MLPALTVTRRLVPRRQLLLGALGILFALGGVASSLGGATPSAPPTAFADQLRPSSWAMTIPSAWLAAPPPRVRVGDTLDVLAVHPGDRAVTVPVAYAVIVLSADEHGLTLDVDQDDAVALANARGGGMLLVPLLRSTR